MAVKRSALPAIVGGLGSLSAAICLAGTFGLSTGDPPNRIDWIVHPNDYMGLGGTVFVTVCADPSSPFSQEMLAPLSRAVATWNAMAPTNDNLSPASEVPPDRFDFESGVLHELGHCALGLGHINEPLAGLFTSGFTEATPGPNLFEDQNNGLDGRGETPRSEIWPILDYGPSGL